MDVLRVDWGRLARIASVMGVIGGFAAACSGVADAAVYSRDYQGGITRSNLDGTNTNTVVPAESLEHNPNAMLSDGEHLYWENYDSIARAGLDGDNVDLDFVSGLEEQPGQLVIADGGLYWAHGNSIGRADVDGTDVVEDFVTGITPIPGSAGAEIAANGDYLYWIDLNDEYPNVDDYQGPTIGRAELDGTNVERSYIKRFELPPNPFHSQYILYDLAVDDDYAYVVAYPPDGPLSIGRVALDDLSAFEPDFIDSEALDGTTGIYDLTLVDGKLYWHQDYLVPPNLGQSWFARADVDGTDVYPKFACSDHLNYQALAVDTEYDAFVGSEPAADFACMLYGHSPTLKYGEQEAFYALPMWAALAWGVVYDNATVGLYATDEEAYESFGATLVDANDDVLASSNPSIEAGDYTASELWGFFAPNGFGATYAGEEFASGDDAIDEPDTDTFASLTKYVISTTVYASDPDGGQQYGHVVRDASGNLWLQYWFFEYYNEFALGAGDHEGDWEGIAIRLDDNNQPDEVVFNTHNGGALCTIDDVETTESGVPVVYVGVGSHASYSRAGSWDASGLVDEAPGDGLVERPRINILDADYFGPNGADSQRLHWLEWPGHWGNTDNSLPGLPDSPHGPAFPPHDQWSDPGEFADNAEGCLDSFDEGGEKIAKAGPPRPHIRKAVLDGTHVRVRYVAPRGAPRRGWPLMRLTLDVKRDGLPPSTFGLRHVKGKGRFTFPLPVAEPDHKMWVLASVVNRRGMTSPVARKLVSR